MNHLSWLEILGCSVFSSGLGFFSAGTKRWWRSQRAVGWRITDVKTSSFESNWNWPDSTNCAVPVEPTWSGNTEHWWWTREHSLISCKREHPEDPQTGKVDHELAVRKWSSSSSTSINGSSHPKRFITSNLSVYIVQHQYQGSGTGLKMYIAATKNALSSH